MKGSLLVFEIPPDSYQDSHELAYPKDTRLKSVTLTSP
jgi:hypothetical protein